MDCRCGSVCSFTVCLGSRHQGRLGAKTSYEDLYGQDTSTSRRAAERGNGFLRYCCIACERYGAGKIAALHASYGQRTQARERRAFTDVADFYGISERLVVQSTTSRAIGGSALTDQKIAVPEDQLGIRGPHGEIPVTYVPFRNAHFSLRSSELGGSHWRGSCLYRRRCRRTAPATRTAARILPGISGTGSRRYTPGNKNRNCHAGDHAEEERNRSARSRARGPLHLTWSCYQRRRCSLWRLRQLLAALAGIR